MNCRTITLLLLGIIFTIFATYFVSQQLALGPSGEVMKKFLHEMINEANQKEWQKAQQSMNAIERHWNRGKKIITLNYAEHELEAFEDVLFRLKGAIRVSDAKTTVEEAMICLDQWDKFLKIVPGP